MKLLVDFFPVLLFFVVYKLSGIYAATAAAIAASAVLVGWTWLRHRRVEKMPLATLGLLIVFGGLTLALHDPIFVMWKPTVVNWLFALVFLASLMIGRKPLIERMMGHAIVVPTRTWIRLNWMWVLFFFISGLANLYVVYDYSGFYEAQQTLLAASGRSDVDLAHCNDGFTGDLLALCLNAQAREEIWVNFKLFGMMGMTIAFVLGQAFYLARHVKDGDQLPQTD